MNIIYAILILYGIVSLICLVVTLRKNLHGSDYKNIFYAKIFDGDDVFSKFCNIIIWIPIVCIVFFIILVFMPFISVLLLRNERKRDKTLKEKNIKTEPNTKNKQESLIKLTSYRFVLEHDNKYRPDENQIFYIETSYNQKINDFLERNYDKVIEIFQTKYRREWCSNPLEFIYFPRIIHNLNLAELLSYNRPDVSDNINISKNELFNNIQNEFINGLCGDIKEVTYQKGKTPVARFVEGFQASQGFVHYIKTDFNAETNKAEDIYSFAQLNYENDEQFLALIEYYVTHTGNHEEVMFYRKKWWQDVPPEYDEEVQQITKEIQERVKRLQCIGLNNMIINKLVLPEVTLSKLRITKNYKIFLTDYNNTEIVMPTLSKTLYFFYLRHTEGVPFKLLENHKEELFQIYKRITNRDDIDALRKSIDYLVDPQYNSINEKASRIKTAFVNEFDDNIAQNYYISLHDTAVALNRRIALDRNLVIDEAGIVKF